MELPTEPPREAEEETRHKREEESWREKTRLQEEERRRYHELLIGTWEYGHPNPSKYTISKSAGGQLTVTERLPTGVKLVGLLQPQGRFLQAELASTDGKKLGTIRVRFDEAQQTAVSQVKAPGAATWGKDVLARREAAVDAPRVERESPASRGKAVGAAPTDDAVAEKLSKFFDTMTKRDSLGSDRQRASAKAVQSERPCGVQARGDPEARPPTCLEPMPIAVPAMADGNALSPFGYVLNKLGPGLACAEAASAGAPLLVLPLTSCWTAAMAKKECPAVYDALTRASTRNPQSKLLQADTTWIALHLLTEYREGGRSKHSAHLKLLPEKFETLLAWSSRDIESLHGSRWKESAKQRQAQVTLDYRMLAAELGPEVVEKLGLDEANYRWARQVLQQFSLCFQGPDGKQVQLLAPGLELLDVDEEVLPSAATLRLEFGVDPAPALVLYASRDMRAGDKVTLQHGGLRCPDGYRLLTCGRQLDANPLNSAEILIKLPVTRENVAPSARFWKILEALESDLQGTASSRQSGECLSPEAVEDLRMVKVVEGKRGPEVRVIIRFGKKQILPDRRALGHLGLVILADSERLEKAMGEEKGVLNPLGQAACERRSISYLLKRIKWALEEMPSRPQADAAKLAAGQSVSERRVRGLGLVAMEKQLLEEAVEEIKQRLESKPTPEQEKELVMSAGDFDSGMPALVAELVALRPGSEPASGSEVHRLLGQMRGCSAALDMVAKSYKALVSQGKLDEAAGQAAKDELAFLAQLLATSRLAPLSAMAPPASSTADVVVKTCGEAFVAAHTAYLAGAEWEVAMEQKRGGKQALRDVFFGKAATSMKLGDAKGALADLQKAFAVAPASQQEQQLAFDVAASTAARSEKILVGDFKAGAATLQGLRGKLKKLGYMLAGELWPQPGISPPVANLATAFDAASAALMKAAAAASNSGKSESEEAPAGKPWWWDKETVKSEIKMLIELFILHRALPLKRVVKLLGKAACKLLVELSVLSCYTMADAKLFDPAEAAKCVEGPQAMDGPLVFANVSLYPVDEDVLVAVDFDQSVPQAVIYVSQDARALALSAPRRAEAKSILDLYCGCGMQGLVALRRYAQTATFADPNPRALRFAEFGTYLNGLEGKATFVKSAGGTADLKGSYNAILSGCTFMPNPGDVVTSDSSIYQGGQDGQAALEKAITTAAAFLAPSGWCCAAASALPDCESLGKRVEGLIDGKGIEATVFRGFPTGIEDFLVGATPWCTEIQKVGYARGLYHQAGVKTMSQGFVFMWKRSASSGAASTVKLRLERALLFKDEEYLPKEVPAVLDKLLLGNAGDEPVYSFDWADAKFEGSAAPSSLALGGPSSPLLPKSKGKDAALQKSMRGMEGATWTDLAATGVVGFSPPILCNVVWKETGGRLASTLTGKEAPVPRPYNTQPPGFPMNVAVLELDGCACPEALREAMILRGSADRITYFGNPKAIRLFKDYNKKVIQGGVTGSTTGSAMNTTVLNDYDALVVPLVGFGGPYQGGDMLDLTREVLLALQFIITQAPKRQKPIRIMLVTCGGWGPGYMEDEVEDVPAVGPVLGLVRAARLEMPQVPVMCIDSDEFSDVGDPQALLGQLNFELDFATPPQGFHAVGPQQRAVALLASNREVAYRAGKRFLPRVELSPRMPIYAGRETSPLASATAQGAIIVTGGIGGVGLLAAEALVEAGAKVLVLTSRSGDVPTASAARVDALRDLGAEVSIERCNTSQDGEVKSLLERVRISYPITAVVHAAGLVDDKPVQNQDATSLAKVFQPKAVGAWLLHKYTQEDNINAFVLFSSVVALRGSAGQSNYAVANCYLDDLAKLRVAQGLPAVSVQWPAVDLTGRLKPAEDGLDVSVSIGTVKQVVKQLFTGLEKISPVQAVLPGAYLVPSSPIVNSQLEPLGVREPDYIAPNKLRELKNFSLVV